jgi:hypothetical protein
MAQEFVILLGGIVAQAVSHMIPVTVKREKMEGMRR